MSAQVINVRWRAFLAPTLATLAALALLIALGAWQLERKGWKEGLIAQIETRAYGAPGEIVPEAAWGAWRAAADEFRHVRVSGTFLHEREVLVHGLMPARRGAPAQGYYVFTPLRRSDGSIVIVNRGFVPTELSEAAHRAESEPVGEVTVTGLVRAPERRGWFMPENDPAREQWFVRATAEMAQARDLERVAPFWIDTDPVPNASGWPRPGQTRLSLPNNHLQYAFTWFALALTLVGIYGAWAWRRVRI